MKVRIGARDLHRFIPEPANGFPPGGPVKLHETRVARRVHEAEGVDAETLHHAVAARNRTIRHHPHEHVRGLGHE